MKHFIFLILIPICLLSKSHNQLEYKIIENISHAIIKKNIVNIYTDSKLYNNKKFKNLKIKFTNTCNNADMALLAKKSVKCKNVPIVALDYSLLKKDKNALGAFYWQKGRPNITFIANRLKKKGIKLPKEYERYIENNVW